MAGYPSDSWGLFVISCIITVDVLAYLTSRMDVTCTEYAKNNIFTKFGIS